MKRDADTPFDPDTVPRLLATGAVPPEIPFQPGKNESPAFSVTNEESANWVVRKIVEARAYGEHVTQYAQRELRRAEREEEFFLRHYGPQLEAWARTEIEKRGGRRKIVRLPAGSIGFRTAPAKLAVTDEGVLVAWCKRHLPGAVAVIERISRVALREHVQTTGECPDGAEITGRHERFYVR